MTPLRQRMLEDLQLRGLAAKTQDSYVRAVRQLAAHYHKSPDLINEEELRLYLLYLKNDKQVSQSGFTIALCGLKFFTSGRSTASGSSSTCHAGRVRKSCPPC